jgi:O-antigen/teichoic acid export membrane protein
MVSKSFMSDHLATHAARGAAKIAVATYLSNLAAVASGIIIPRFLGKDAYGEYAFLTASFLLAGMSSRLGLRLIITRQFAPLYNSRELDKAAGLYRAYFLTNLASGLIVSAICFFFLEFASPFKISSSAFILVSLLLFTWSLSESLFVLQLGVRHYGYWGLVFLLRSLTRLLLVVPGFIIGGMPGAVGGLLLGEGLTALTGYRLSSDLLPAKQIRPDFRLLWSHARLAILAFVTQLADNLRRYLGVMLVAFVTLNTDLTGYYELSLRIAVLVSSSLLLTAGSLMPTLSILYEQKDESRLFDWIELATRGGLFILILIWGVFALVGRPLIVFLVGESFEAVYPLVFILLLSLPFRWIETMYDQSCNVNQRPELNIPSRIVWLTSFVALGIWGLDKWNLPGLAAAYCLSFIVSCGVSYLVAWRALRVRIVKMRSLTMLLCASPFVAALFWSVGVYERTIAASISVLLGFLIAQLSSSLRVNEIATLFRIAKGL